MIELFTLFKVLESYSNNVNIPIYSEITINENFNNSYSNNIPTSWIIMALIISFGTAYIAYACNQFEKPATRALSTIIAFFFSGFYLIYYFIVHVLFDRPCASRGISNIIKNISKK
jgi:uncharacterized protein YybS (DUF2232 family)